MLCFDAPHDITDKLSCWCCAYFVCVCFVVGVCCCIVPLQADPHLPRRQRRRSSIIREEKVAALRDLPMLKDTSLSKREVRVQRNVFPVQAHKQPTHSSSHSLSLSVCIPPDSVQAKACSVQRQL